MNSLEMLNKERGVTLWVISAEMPRCGGREKGRRHSVPAGAWHEFDLVEKKWDDVARQKVIFRRGGCKSRMRRPCREPGDDTHQAKKLAGLDVLCEGRTSMKHGWKRSSTWARSQVRKMKGREESGWCCNTSSWSTLETSFFSWLASTYCLTDCPGFCKLVTGFNIKYSFATESLADWVTNISTPVELQVIHWANPFSPRHDCTCGRIWLFLT